MVSRPGPNDPMSKIVECCVGFHGQKPVIKLLYPIKLIYIVIDNYIS